MIEIWKGFFDVIASLFTFLVGFGNGIVIAILVTYAIGLIIRYAVFSDKEK